MEWDPARGLHQGQQSFTDCANRPNRGLHPTYVRTSNYPCNAGAIHRGAIRRERPLVGGGEVTTRVGLRVLTAAMQSVKAAVFELRLELLPRATTALNPSGRQCTPLLAAQLGLSQGRSRLDSMLLPRCFLADRSSASFRIINLWRTLRAAKKGCFRGERSNDPSIRSPQPRG
jgi:hypothetical protein